VFSKW